MKLSFGILILPIFLILSGCAIRNSGTRGSKVGPDAGIERRRVEEYFVSSGVERYFLPEIPNWANFSEDARCRRKTSIKFFNMEFLRASLNLSYEESIQLQLMFNDEVQKVKAEKNIIHIPFENEEEIFYQVNERIQAGIRAFRKPTFKRVNIIWIDPYFNNIASLRSLMKRSEMYKGHPIFVSLCLTSKEMGIWMKKNSFDNQNIRKISYELLTPYTVKGKLDTTYHMNFDELLRHKKIYFYIKKGWNKPALFDGHYKLRRL